MFWIALSARELQLAQLILHVLVYVLLEFIAAHSLAAMLFLAGSKCNLFWGLEAAIGGHHTSQSTKYIFKIIEWAMSHQKTGFLQLMLLCVQDDSCWFQTFWWFLAKVQAIVHLVEELFQLLHACSRLSVQHFRPWLAPLVVEQSHGFSLKATEGMPSHGIKQFEIAIKVLFFGLRIHTDLLKCCRKQLQ